MFVTKVSPYAEALLEERPGRLVVSLAPGQRAYPMQHLGPQVGGQTSPLREHFIGPLTPFAHVAVQIPEAPQGPREPGSSLHLPMAQAPGQRGSQVVVLALQALKPCPLIRAQQLGLGPLRQLQKYFSMAPPD